MASRKPDLTIDVVIRWDHRITDALMARALARLEQVLNSGISVELRSHRREPKPVRA
jgi:hypothetical protein